MIKFFRRIRQSLIIENSTGRYFKYAIGEIILVVIGILIALQINNWNEDRLIKKNEITILRQLNIDLRENYIELDDLYQTIDSSNISGKKFLNAIKNETVVSDSMKQWIERFSNSNIFNNANTTYKNVENSAKNIISNDSLRLRITIMYEKYFTNVHKREIMLYNEYLPNYKTELIKNFKTGPSTSKWLVDQEFDINTPINLKTLKENEAFKNVFIELYNFRLLRLNWLKDTLERLEKLIQDIDKEIELLS